MRWASRSMDLRRPPSSPVMIRMIGIKNKGGGGCVLCVCGPVLVCGSVWEWSKRVGGGWGGEVVLNLD